MSVAPQSYELGLRMQLTFLVTASALANSWSESCFSARVAPSASVATSGLDASRFTDSTLRRGGTCTQNVCCFAGRGLGSSPSPLRFPSDCRARSTMITSSWFCGRAEPCFRCGCAVDSLAGTRDMSWAGSYKLNLRSSPLYTGTSVPLTEFLGLASCLTLRLVATMLRPEYVFSSFFGRF